MDLSRLQAIRLSKPGSSTVVTLKANGDVVYPKGYVPTPADKAFFEQEARAFALAVTDQEALQHFLQYHGINLTTKEHSR